MGWVGDTCHKSPCMCSPAESCQEPQTDVNQRKPRKVSIKYLGECVLFYIKAIRPKLGFTETSSDAKKKKKKIRHDSHVWGSVSLTFPLCHFSVKAGETQIFSLIDWVWLCWFEQLRQTFSPQWWNSFIFTHMPLHCVASVSHPHPSYLLKISTGQMDTDASTSVSWQISLFCWSHHPAHIYLKYLEQKGCLEFQHSVIQLLLGCRWKI